MVDTRTCLTMIISLFVSLDFGVTAAYDKQMDDSTSESQDAVAQSLESNLSLKLCRMLGFMCMTWKRQLAVEMESPRAESEA